MNGADQTPLQALDRVEITVLMDNVTDSLSTVPDGVTKEWDMLRLAGMKVLAGSCQCCANHGLSLLVKTWLDGTSHTLLFDAGPAEETLAYNVERLGVDMGQIEAVVLSHGHWDHGGGLPKAFELIHAAAPGREPVPCYLHPGMFVQRAIPRPLGGVLPIKTPPDPAFLAQCGALSVVDTEATTLLDGHFYLSGEIPRRNSFERGFRGHVRQDEDGQWVPDPLIMDERYLAFHILGKGLFALSACSHAGIVNVATDVRERFAPVPVHGVMGGFHLSGANESVIGQTVEALAQFDMPLLAPGHCTGWRAVNALTQRLGEACLVPTSVGQHYVLSAQA
jgi:7,8-dihydropterin-6-yl-methyl-4-(beta-D-ribofuranosyl)aminobenzene 5'-phosphate synthase